MARLLLTLRNGNELEGEESDVQQLLRFTSGFGAGQGGLPLLRRVTSAAGVEETTVTCRWVNSNDVSLITEVPDA